MRASRFLAIASMVLLGCEHSFEPKGPFDERMVIYCIVSTKSDAALVRVYTTYEIPAFDPSVHIEDTPVRDASVTLLTSNMQYLFRDTTIRRDDQSRYNQDIPAFVFSPLHVSFGQAYTLKVNSTKLGSVEATTRVPELGTLETNSWFVLEEPKKYGREDIFVFARLAAVSKGFMIRLLIEFEVVENAKPVLKRVEVPLSVRNFADSTHFESVYPTLTRRTTSANQAIAGNRETVIFPNGLYRLVLTKLFKEFPLANLRRAMFELIQIEPNLYNYYNIANGFQDQFSIRLDEADYSSISGALGVFGAFAVQSIEYAYKNERVVF